MTAAPPPPRKPVANPALSRPDWTKAQPRDPAMLWLDKNENTDPALSAVVAGVMRGLPAEAYFTYPDSAALYTKLAGWVGCAANNLLLAAGSDGVIRSVFEAYVAEGDTVLHTVPTFAMYPVYCRIFGARAVGMGYQPSPAGPRLDAETVIAAIKAERPKLVCLPNPDSPTGTVFAPEALEAIAAAAGAAGALILIDEAYHPFHPDTVAPWIERHPHLVVARSTGKAWGMAGLRIGYAIASPEVAVMLHKVRPMYEVNTVAVHAFDRMLDHSDAMQASVGRLMEGKALFLGAMIAMGFKTLSGRGNFLHVAFGERAPRVHAGLADLVYYRPDFAEPCLKGFSRFSATTPELFAPVIQRIKESCS
ncbi:MAG: aminotransferase class I/II-fold pyridoxal phosphate-dependent enzyme [Magnetospirillum sp.]|nr:aminotransferase class I/II-fold pyridoxal phosphate-dependent enzyme [Magnetospirillum sp.]